METVFTLSQCLREILARYGVSASELSRRMGFSSRNSVFRILNGECSPEKQREFLDRLVGCAALPLTEQELSDLERGMEVSREGAERFYINRAMEEIVLPNGSEVRELQIIHWQRGAETKERFGDWLGRIFRCECVRLLIVGCCERSVFAALAKEIAGGRAHDVQITHYIDATGIQLVRAIAAIQPVLYCGGYQAYMFEGSGQSRLYECDMVLATCVDGEGRCRSMQAIMTDESSFYCCEFEDDAPSAFLTHILTRNAQAMKPIKSAFMRPASPMDYLQYTELYRQIEEDTILYDVKSDVPINYIHPDILLEPVRDGFAQAGFCEAEEREALVQAFYDVQLRRWENFFGKRKPTHTIFTYERMRDFALTGRQSDHFFAIRPYTPQERVKILRFLRRQTAYNPYFTVYFFRQGVTPVQDEIGLYEGKGVLLTRPHTDYRLDGEHAEALITQREFCDCFREYYQRKLLAGCVTSARETLAIMDELIALASGQNDGKNRSGGISRNHQDKGRKEDEHGKVR